MTLISYVFPKVETAKDVLVKSLKIPVSEHPSTVNMLNIPKNCTKALISYVFITLARIEL